MACAVYKRDDKADNFRDQIFRKPLTHMMEEPGTITGVMDLILISRYLERIAYPSTNISEEMIYIAGAKVMEHRVDQQ